jgi:hypothetical protein
LDLTILGLIRHFFPTHLLPDVPEESEIEPMVNTLKRQDIGVIQPLPVREIDHTEDSDAKKYEIVGGGIRYEAARRAGPSHGSLYGHVGQPYAGRIDQHSREHPEVQLQADRKSSSDQENRREIWRKQDGSR